MDLAYGHRLAGRRYLGSRASTSAPQASDARYRGIERKKGAVALREAVTVDAESQTMTLRGAVFSGETELVEAASRSSAEE